MTHRNLTTIQLLILLLLGLPVLADQPDPEPVSSSEADLKKMQGTWEIARAEKNGADAAKEIAGVRVVIQKDRLVIKDPKRDEAVTIKLDAKKKPSHIDLFPDKARREMVKGIYRFDKGELIIVFADPGQARPAKFDDKARGKLVLRRHKAKK
jgi:uncharacterized protein (TIGR03067 family)